MTRAAALPWSLATIDFEASSLEWDGCPIEVGIALWHAPAAPILGWSALIRPPLDWREGGHWSRASAKLHGITRAELLADGLAVEEVMTRLNALLAPYATVWCDGGRFDTDWLAALFRAGRAEPGFVLSDWSVLLSRLDDTGRSRAQRRSGTDRRHRAGEDARHLMLAIAAGLGVPDPAWDPLRAQDEDQA